MKIQKLKIEDKQFVQQCDKLFLDFLDSEGKYDENYKKRENIKSFLNDLTDENNILLVAVEESKVLGFVYGYIENRKDGKLPVAHIAFVYVDLESRNRKIASNLIDKFLEELKCRQIQIVEVKSFESNEIAKKLYQKYGFNIIWSNYRKNI